MNHPLSKFSIFDLELDNLTPAELLNDFSETLGQTIETMVVITPNPEMIVLAEKNKKFKKIIQSANRLLLDGTGLRFALWWRYGPVTPDCLTGVNALKLLATACAHKKVELCIIGGPSDYILDDCAKQLVALNPSLKISWQNPGLIDAIAPQLPEATLRYLKQEKPRAIAVGLGMFKQENIIIELKKLFPTERILIGVGGAFDIISGHLPAAPNWRGRDQIIKAVGDWWWRWYLEPHRTNRMFTALVKFPILFLSQYGRTINWRSRFQDCEQTLRAKLLKKSAMSQPKQPINKVRVRIAPSPTGFIHIGTLRTALVNYLFAKKQGGDFIIRIEDTDAKRFVPNAIESMLKTLMALGLVADEGPTLVNDQLSESGPLGPYQQSKRLPLYLDAAQNLLKNGQAYYCFCSEAVLEELHTSQVSAKQTPKYDRRCFALTGVQVQDKLARLEPHVIRLLIPEGESSWNDLVRDQIVINHKDLDDQILIKSDGFPTYHLAVVVDDHLMQISHVLRGEEWISSTPKHLILYKAFGWGSPEFGHLSLLVNPDRSKLSKRQGDVAVEEFLNKGYLKEALINFIGTFGFNPQGDRELYSIEELQSAFDISKFKSSPVALNLPKLDWMNSHYLKTLGEGELLNRFSPFSKFPLTNPTVVRAVLMARARAVVLPDLNAGPEALLERRDYEPTLLMNKNPSPAETRAVLIWLKLIISGWSDETFTALSILENLLKEEILATERKNGLVLWPLRVALSGQAQSASPFECLWVLGKTESLARLELAIANLDAII